MRSGQPARELGHRPRAGRRGHRRRRQHHDGLLERPGLPAGWPFARQGGRGGSAAGREVLAHGLLGGAVRGLRGARRAVGPRRGRRPQGGALQLRRRGRGERRQVREGGDGTAGCRLLRGGVPRADAPDHVTHQPAYAIQARVRAVRVRGASGAVQLSVPQRRPRAIGTARAGGASTRVRSHDRPAFCCRLDLRARAGRGRLHRSRPRVLARRAGALSRARHRDHRR